jgi:hypothetical protein
MKNFKSAGTKVLKGGIILLMMLSAPAALLSEPIEPVNLGSTARFAILSASLITNNPISAVTGDVGLSPAAGSAITGFGLSEVTGTIYTTDATGPAGSVQDAELLTAAKGDLTLAYNDAAGRTPVPEGDFLNPGSGNLAGQILVPGLYKFTGTAEITGGDLTFDAQNDSNAVFIMMVATALNTASETQVVLVNKAKAENIFWQVGTSAALGTYSVFKGTIMADQSVTMASGASIEGRLLASIAAVTIDACIVNRPKLPSGIEDGQTGPEEFALMQNYPNPFNPATVIRYNIANDSRVSLKVFDMLGKEVAILVDENQKAGNYSVEFGTNNGTENLSTGAYFYRLEAGTFAATKKLILMK